MFQRILVPLDGSTRAERALPVAARIARAAGSTIVLLRAVTFPAELTPYLIPEGALAQQVSDEQLAEAAKYLASIAQSDQLMGIATETITIDGPPAPTILDAAHTRDIDLVIMCSHGYTGFTRWMLGSVAEKVARLAPAPVLVLHEHGSVLAGPHPNMERPLRALVALDGSQLAEAALAPTAQLVTALTAPASGAVHLVRVLRPPFGEGESGVRIPVDKSTHEEILHQTRQYLDSVAERFRTGDLADLHLLVTWSVAFDTDVAGTLIRIAENGEDATGIDVFGKCDLIAMATHGRSGFVRWALGSITERVLQATRLPIFVVRPLQAKDKRKVTTEESIEAGTGIWTGLL